MQQFLIFSDLDGSLLDHNNYRFDAAIPALESIRNHQIPLILNSSKTLNEMLDIRLKLQNTSPFAIENGSAIFIPQHTHPDYYEPLTKILLGTSREKILQTLRSLRELNNFAFEGFADFSIQQIMQKTGLSETAAIHANQRIGTEPIQWLDSERNLTHFQFALEKKGLKLIKGGRFLHVMGQTDKANAMQWLLNLYRKNSTTDYISIAVGDSQNDQEMLQQADIACVIQNIDGKYLHLGKVKGQVIQSTKPASEGWLQVMNQVFKKCNKGEINE